MWELGGARADRSRELAGTFFLGCGLPAGGALYCLGEQDGEISLFKLDSATGARIWSQGLSLPLGRLPHFPLRRLAGGNPSCSDGILVCPTTAGIVIALDMSSRNLAWEYTYKINVAGEGVSDPRANWLDEPLSTGNDESARWLDSSPVIAHDRVILTPRDSDELHCLNLSDGSLRWKRDRGNGLFLAGVFDRTVVVVGKTSVEALRLDDGKPAWKGPAQIPSPAGRGFRSGPFYHFPLSTDELATIDLRKGRVIARSMFPGDLKPGNLVAAAGMVVLQSIDAVRGFQPTATWEAAIAKTLNQHPNEPAALAARGELRLHLGQTDAGLDDLLRSLKARPDARARSVAVAAFLENLRFDFAHARQTASQTEPLLVEPAQRYEFRRLMAKGLEHAGDNALAFDQILHLAEDKTLSNTLVSGGESLQTKVSQVVASELGALFSKTTAAEKIELQKKINDWTSRLTAGGSVQQLKDALAALHELPEDAALRRALVRKLEDQPDKAEIVRQLNRLRRSADLEGSGAATARLARLLIEHDRAQQALPLLKELNEKFGRVVCADKKTGADLAHAWQSNASVKKALAEQEPWPAMQLSVKRIDQTRPVRAINSLPIDQHDGPFFRHWRFESQNPTERGFTLVAFDGNGIERWRLNMNAGNLGEAAKEDTPIAMRIHGPLLQLLMRRRFVVLDGFDGKAPPRILWTRELFDPNGSRSAQLRSETSLSGLLCDDYVFYPIGPVLCCADAFTGDILWRRRNISYSYGLQGDQDYIIALRHSEPMDPYGLVLHTANGAEVFGGPFGIPGPLAGEWKGRRVLTTSAGASRITFSLVDVVRRTPVWSHSYSTPVWPLPIDDDEFAVLDSEYKLRVHSIETGATVFETQLERDQTHPQLMMRRIGDRYVIVSHAGVPRLPSLREFPGSAGGIITAYDRSTSKKEWSATLALPAIPIEVPANSPVLVLVRPVRRMEAHRSLGAGTAIIVLDARNRATLYKGEEPTPADRIHVQVDPVAHNVIIAMDKSRLEITPSPLPLSGPAPESPVQAPRPAAKN